MGFIDFYGQYWPLLMSGTMITVAQFLLGATLTIVLGLVAGLMMMSSSKFVKVPSVIYIEIFRGTSLLVQLYWIFFVLPLFGVTLEKFTAGWVAIGLNAGAYGAELVRGGIMAVPKGQWEAATAINMSSARKMRRIILPQALVNMLPAWGNLMIEILKGTALVSLISVTDLMFQAKQINASTYQSAQIFGAALLIYYLLARLVLTPFMRGLESFMARKLGKV
jgi:polar amino acid transport system permease protein